MSRTTTPLLALLAIALLAACAPTHDALVREDPPLMRILRAGASAGRTIRATTRAGDGRPIAVAVEEIGRGERGRTVVLLHGAFSSRHTWRYLAGDLAQDHDLLLVDLPGCGESDCPSEPALSPGEFSPDILARRVMEALRAVFRARTGRPAITLVGHSLGAAVALQMVGDPDLRAEFAEVAASIDALVLISPLDLDIREIDPAVVNLATVDGMFIKFASFIGLLDERIARAIVRSADRPSVAYLEDAREKEAILTRWHTRAVAQAILRDAVPFRDGHPDHDRIAPLTARYAAIDRPVLIIHGSRDDVLPPRMSEDLAAKLPRARVQELPHAKHSPQIGHALDCAELIRLFPFE